jgi:hypothetical protein
MRKGRGCDYDKQNLSTVILRNGLPRYGCDNNTNDLTEPLWTLGPVASLLAATRYGIFNKLPDRIE